MRASAPVCGASPREAAHTHARAHTHRPRARLRACAYVMARQSGRKPLLQRSCRSTKTGKICCRHSGQPFPSTRHGGWLAELHTESDGKKGDQEKGGMGERGEATLIVCISLQIRAAGS